MTGTLAVKLFSRIGVGVGVTLTPTLSLPTTATYDPHRSTDVDKNVVLDIERELKFGAAAIAGIRAEVIDELALGFAFRQIITTAAAGPNDIQAGGLTVQDDVDFYDFLEPQQVVLGAAVFPVPDWSFSVDGVLARWSDYHTIHHRRPPEAFSDVVYLRTGLEWETPLEWLDVRTGYAFEPSPIPPQTGTTNLLGGSAHVLGVGAGFDLRPMDWAPIRFDTHFRTHLLQTHRDDKSLDALPDVDPETPGHQIANLGYPGFSADASYFQIGLTINVFFGSDEVAE